MRGHELFLAALGATILALAIPAAASASEVTIINKSGQNYDFVLTATPKERAAGRRVTVTLDLAQTPMVPDPTFGDRVPVRGASLIATVKPKEGGSPMRYGLHPLMGAGVYGFHFTPATTGLYQVTFAQRGVELPEFEFVLGVGVDTPADTEAPQEAMGLRQVLAGGRRPARGTSRGPITPMTGGASSKKAMQAMVQPAGLLGEALGKPKPLISETTPALDALLEQARTLKGTVPDAYRSASAEYDQLAERLVSELEALKAKSTPKDLRAGWDQVRDSTCASCHVKFWWAITPDLSTWPKISYQTWKR
ncbi:MAG: hypothetical protein P1V51_13995 [Deltaproteobacteria bacterium]|nr:hypothetical protein [Deltaproteobacteria bacterium]